MCLLIDFAIEMGKPINAIEPHTTKLVRIKRLLRIHNEKRNACLPKNIRKSFDSDLDL